jgi:hypothetical protein
MRADAERMAEERAKELEAQNAKEEKTDAVDDEPKTVDSEDQK